MPRARARSRRLLAATRRGRCYRSETLGTPRGNSPLVACGSEIRPIPEDRCSPVPTRSPPTSATTTSNTSTSASATCPASCSTSPSRRRRSARTPSARASASTARPSAGSRRSTSRTCCCCPTPTAPSSTRSATHKTLNVNFFIHDPITREAYSRDPRNMAKKAEAYLASTGIADTAYFGPEAEFYIFDSIRYRPHQRVLLPHRLRSRAPGTRARSPARTAAPTSGTRPATRAATSRSSPYDHYSDLRDDDDEPDQRRARARAWPPRGGHRRSGRDQLQVRHAAARRPTA